MTALPLVALCSLLVALTGCAPGGRSTPRPSAAVASACASADVALLVLGSGGPILDDDRAGSGYAVLADGSPRLLVDAGPGVGLRIAQAGLDMSALRAVLVSHLHVDHSSDLVTLLKSASFSRRDDPLALVGPDGAGPFPGFRDFMATQLGEGGAYAYLGGPLSAGTPYPIELHEVPGDAAPTSLRFDGVRVDVVGVPHGPVPALGFVVHVAGRRLAFGGDQTLNDPRFLTIARGADILVAHHAVSENVAGVAANLHARPSQIGSFARRAEVRQVVLSHHMRRSLDRLDEALGLITASYSGPVTVANDLDCYLVE